MEYLEFERILSAKRIQRYKDAANGDTRKAMALYRYNLRLSQEMFTIVSCFEVALRNAIDSLLVPSLGEDWLKDSVQDMRAFPNKPRSSAAVQYNNTYIFNELDKVNSLRNRIAHHEPICFRLHEAEIDTSYIINEYQKIQTLFSWMGIDSHSMLYGLDHVQSVCAKINSLKV